MNHVDPETLALLALGETVADSSDRVHLSECDECAAEFANFKRAATVGRASLDAGELQEPAPRVWARISEELGLESDTHATVTTRSSHRRGWTVLLAAAASIALIGSIGTVMWRTAQPEGRVVVASATLDALPTWSEASGEATVEQLADGERVVQVSLDAPVLTDAYAEVWLITSDASKLVSLGTIRGTTGTLAIPDRVDLSAYTLVDISAEPYDGDPAHSGNSIVRGQLQ